MRPRASMLSVRPSSAPSFSGRASLRRWISWIGIVVRAVTYEPLPRRQLRSLSYLGSGNTVAAGDCLDQNLSNLVAQGGEGSGSGGCILYTHGRTSRRRREGFYVTPKLIDQYERAFALFATGDLAILE